jgi:hypothetical protein
MKPINAKRERGAALLALLAVIMLGASWFLVSQLNAESGGIAAARKNRNAEVLNHAKQALIGYVAAQAAKAGENNPGAMPCPENLGDFDSTTGRQGLVGTTCGTTTIGRFPWRTLGLDQLVDASGEPLWYVVSPGWGVATGSNTTINSNSVSQLTVDGVPNDAVALIIAPGPAFAVPAAAGCTAWNQVRPTIGTPDWRNYLECENATSPADAIFVTTGPSASFNDQVIKLTVADVMPAIEAAIAHRIEREIVPALKDVYLAPNWGLTTWPAGPSPPGVLDRIYPYAAPFGNPDAANFSGTSVTTRGLLPLAHSETFPGSGVACTIDAVADPRCNPTLVSWSNASPSISFTGLGVTLTSGCSYWGPTDYAVCSGTYTGTPTQITVSGPQSNGAMSLRAVNAAATGLVFWFDLLSGSFTSLSPSPSLRLNNNGTLTVSITAAPPAPAGLAGVMYWIYVPGNATSDHSLLDGRAAASAPPPPSTAWFMRNEWHKLVYYALSPGYAASDAAPRACALGTCLSVTNVTPTGLQRAILVLAGRSINGSARPSATLGNYLEFGNATAAYERRTVSASNAIAPAQRFNDRIVVIDSN